MLAESLMALLGCCIGTAITVPIAVLFAKWKKETDAERKE